MIILNCDDLGRSVDETDAAVTLARHGRVTSVSAMVFMADSERACALTQELTIDVGLHLNFCEAWSGRNVSKGLAAEQQSLIDFLNRSRYAQIFYNPLLRRAFKNVYEAQFEEFQRLYGRTPSHIDGHRHLHLCCNALIDCPIPYGSRVRRNFTFESHQKGSVNRMYRGLVDAYLGRRYQLTDYFFSLDECLDGCGTPLSRVANLSKSSVVEIMVHPKNQLEFDFLDGQHCLDVLDIDKQPSHRAKPSTRVLDRALRLGALVASACECTAFL